MPAHCLMYDLRDAQKVRYDAIDAAMKKVGGAKVLNTTWMFDPAAVTLDAIATAIAPLLTQQDKLLIVEAYGPHRRAGLNQDWQTWLDQHV